MMKLTGRIPRTHIALAASMLAGLSPPAIAEQFCHIADPKDPTLNLREEPGGTVLGTIDNGRVVESTKPNPTRAAAFGREPAGRLTGIGKAAGCLASLSDASTPTRFAESGCRCPF